MLKVTVDAMDEDQSIGLAAPSFGTQSLLSFVGGQITVAGANFDVTDVSVQGDNGLKTDRYFLRSNTLKKEPVHNSFRAFTGTLTAEFTDLSAYNRYVNGTLASVTATWVGAQIEAVTPTYFYTLQVTMPQVRFDGETPDISGPDIITQSLPFKALWDGTTSPVTVLYRTTDTTE